ncbi:MAG: hypothetical protein SGI92_27865 [Bryobacteraceae bacterium]|nr:hypothetical protein [Bryobacteraceae bacterium]
MSVPLHRLDKGGNDGFEALAANPIRGLPQKRQRLDHGSIMRRLP